MIPLSYCVNCGVRLAPSEQHCPLCDTEVINPKNPWEEPEYRPYPAYLERLVKAVDRQYLSVLAAVILMIPVTVCLVVDLLTASAVTWSGYVIGAAMVIAVLVLLPIGMGVRRPWLFLTLDVLAILLYLFLIEQKAVGAQWFLTLAMPLTLACGLACAFNLLYYKTRKERYILVALAVFLFSVGGLTMAVDVIIRLHRGLGAVPNWSWYSFLPCALSGVAFLILNKRQKWKDSVKKRLFF